MVVLEVEGEGDKDRKVAGTLLGELEAIRMFWLEERQDVRIKGSLSALLRLHQSSLWGGHAHRGAVA